MKYKVRGKIKSNRSYELSQGQFQALFSRARHVEGVGIFSKCPSPDFLTQIWEGAGLQPRPGVSTLRSVLMKTSALSPKGARAESLAFHRFRSFIVHFITNVQTPGWG